MNTDPVAPSTGTPLFPLPTTTPVEAPAAASDFVDSLLTKAEVNAVVEQGMALAEVDIVLGRAQVEAETPPGFSEAAAEPAATVESVTVDQLPDAEPGEAQPVTVEVKSLSLPLYQCHKQVRAAKIAKVDTSFVRPEISFEDASLAPVSVDAAWVAKHQPQAGGYFVVYADGYRSYSPADAFEDGYTAI